MLPEITAFKTKESMLPPITAIPESVYALFAIKSAKQHSFCNKNAGSRNGNSTG
jgi:hypothetical protein